MTLDESISFQASLAVVELTIAIHHVFHAPVDKILWDVGDQVRFDHKCLGSFPFTFLGCILE